MTDSPFSILDQQYPTKNIVINNKPWEYLVKGTSSRAIILFPGGGQIAQSSYQLIDHLSKSHKVISFTISDVDSIAEFCIAVDKIRSIESSGKVAIYGLSLGALLAQSYAQRHVTDISALIISHGCLPHSKTYKKKIIFPLEILSFFLPFIPQFLITQFSKQFSYKLQGGNKQKQYNKIQILLKRKYYEKYFTKRLLLTWIKLHKGFYHEKFSEKNFRKLRNNILILRTDNDPLMQDEGEFQEIYPNAFVYTFQRTGHLTYYLQTEKMTQVILTFLSRLK